MISGALTRISAVLLATAGVLLLFAADRLLPALVAGYPTSGLWFGQLLAAALLGIAALNWLQRHAVLGGIYGRPVVFANLVFYFISAMTVLRLVIHGQADAAVLAVGVVVSVLAIAYGALLLRGPFESLQPGIAGE